VPALSRREWLRLALGATALALGGASMAAPTILRRPVPKTGEPLPVIGLGTWQTFDVPEDRSAPLREVLDAFVRLGGSVVDSSPMYGRSESVLGALAADLGIRDRLFIATKVWTQGRDAGVRQMEESLRRLRTETVDLMQVHNLVDWRVHLETLKRWKTEGRTRYVGVTHYTESAYGELEGALKNEAVDFVQLNYSVAERAAERRLLPLAAERRVAVLVNRPLAAGALFGKVRATPLPPWAAEAGAASWAEFFLKFVISHPAVTCALPATSNPSHLAENMRAGLPPLPDAAMRERMARYVAAL